MAIYQISIGDNRLNGIHRDYPDTFLGWEDPNVLESKLDDFLDKTFIKSLTSRKSYLENDNKTLLFSKKSRFVNSKGGIPVVKPFQVIPSRTTFISHASQDAFAAFALFHFLAQSSQGVVFPLVDMCDIEEGDPYFWNRIESMLKASDCVVVLITTHTKNSIGVKKEVALANKLRIPVLGFWLSGDDLPSYLKKSWVTKLPNYCDWLFECEKLIGHISKKSYLDRTSS